MGRNWIPTTVQILPAPTVQILPSPQKFVNSPILGHEDLYQKADINKIHKTPSLIIAMFKTKPKTNDWRIKKHLSYLWKFTPKGQNQIECDYTLNNELRPQQIWLKGRTYQRRFPWAGVSLMTLAIRAGDPLSKSSHCPKPPYFPLPLLFTFELAKRVCLPVSQLSQCWPNAHSTRWLFG